MPGSGKTTVGKMLAKRLNIDFCDTDDLIIKRTGVPLQETLDKHGKDVFLETERSTLVDFVPANPMVIATGGSVVLHSDAMEHLKSFSTVVFLDADLPLIRKRLWNLDSRGIVFSDNEEDVLGVYREREPKYYQYSDIRIHIRGKRVNEIVREICDKLS